LPHHYHHHWKLQLPQDEAGGSFKEAFLLMVVCFGLVLGFLFGLLFHFPDQIFISPSRPVTLSSACPCSFPFFGMSTKWHHRYFSCEVEPFLKVEQQQ
jgi:hypothetical protein